MKRDQKKDKGYALMTVLIFFTVLLIIGLGLGYITQKGYLSISAEAKFAKAEKLANMGLLGLLNIIESGNCTVGERENCTTNYLSEKESFKVCVQNDTNNNYCFVWSEGNYSGARVVKTAIFPSWGFNWGAGVFRNLTKLDLGGSAAIVGYDSSGNDCGNPDSCIAPALVTGNDLGLKVPPTPCGSQPNPKGLISTVDPYKPDPDLANKDNKDLTDMLFNAHNRTEMLVKFSEIFKVKFVDGKPDGIENPDFSGNFNNCEASGDTITCDGNEFKWKGTYYEDNKGNRYISIDLGPNAQITIQKNKTFTGGGIIAGKNIIFEGNVASTSLTLIARNQIDMSSPKANNINVQNTFMFAQNYNISANGMTIKNSIIYSGGDNGNLTIDLSGRPNLGTKDYPVLIISDNNINLQQNGNAEIWGVIFATEKNNNFKIGIGNGNFKIHGTVISNSNSTNNQIDLSGNFEIRFNFNTIYNLYKNISNLGFKFLRPPVCGDKRKLLKLTGMRVY